MDNVRYMFDETEKKEIRNKTESKRKRNLCEIDENCFCCCLKFKMKTTTEKRSFLTTDFKRNAFRVFYVISTYFFGRTDV